jgi:hypothetical protein
VGGEALAADDSGPGDVVSGYGYDPLGNRSALSWSYDTDALQWMVHQVGAASGYPSSEARGVRAIAGRSSVGAVTGDGDNNLAAYWNESSIEVTFLSVSECGAAPPVVDQLNVATAIDDDERIVGWGTVQSLPPNAAARWSSTAAGFTSAIADTDTVAWIAVPTAATSVGDPPSIDGVALSAYPNPFHPDVRISFRVPQSTRVRLVVYDVQGRRVRTLLDGHAAGTERATWNGTNDDGTRVAAGVYFLRLYTPTTATTRKIMVLR